MNEILLLGKRILWDQSELLLKSAPDSDWLSDWEPLGGEWRYEDGYLIGVEPENKGGLLLSRQSFEGDIIFRFRAASVLPATRDVNAAYCAEWDHETDYLKAAYIIGLGGWYDHKCGIERFPEDEINVTTPLYHYEPGTEVEITTGVIQGHNFLVVDGKLVLELIDPCPRSSGRVGFSPYCTMLKIRDIEAGKPYWEERNQRYEPEF